MGKKADRQAARIEAARERAADELWRSRWVREWAEIGTAIGKRAGVVPEDPRERRFTRRALHGAQLMAMVALMGSSGTRVR